MSARPGPSASSSTTSISSAPPTRRACPTPRPSSSSGRSPRVRADAVAAGVRPRAFLRVVELVGLRSHDEVVAVEAFDLVLPPAHLRSAPLGQQGRMMSLVLGEPADPVRELERVRKVREFEDPRQAIDPADLVELPSGPLRMALRALLC